MAREAGITRGPSAGRYRRPTGKARQALRVMEPYDTPDGREELAARHLARMRCPLPPLMSLRQLSSKLPGTQCPRPAGATGRNQPSPGIRARSSQPALIGIGRVARLSTAAIVSPRSPAATMTREPSLATPKLRVAPGCRGPSKVTCRIHRCCRGYPRLRADQQVRGPVKSARASPPGADADGRRTGCRLAR